MRILCLIVFLPLVACQTTYRPLHADIFGNIDGYRDLRLDSDVYRVTFYGSDRDDVRNYALYRAAELTVQKDRDCFVVLDTSQHSHWWQYSTLHLAFTTVRMLRGPCSQPQVRDAKEVLATMSPHIRR